MSTRSNTVIEDLATGEKAYLYRHFDGYLSGAGIEQTGYVNLMKKEIPQPTVSKVQAWYLKNGEGYEETSGVHGDVEFIYVLELNRPEAKYCLRAYDTEMFATAGGSSAAKGKELTGKLHEEVDRAMTAGELDDVWGFRPEDCAERCVQDDGVEDSREQLWDKVATAVDDIWEGWCRAKLVDEIVSRLQKK